MQNDRDRGTNGTHVERVREPEKRGLAPAIRGEEACGRVQVGEAVSHLLNLAVRAARGEADPNDCPKVAKAVNAAVNVAVRGPMAVYAIDEANRMRRIEHHRKAIDELERPNP